MSHVAQPLIVFNSGKRGPKLVQLMGFWLKGLWTGPRTTPTVSVTGPRLVLGPLLLLV